MATRKTTLPSADEAIAWLSDNPDIYIQAVERLQLKNLRLCDAIALRPQIYLDLATSVYKAAATAGATKEVLLALKTQAERIKIGLAKLPKVAYAWMTIAQLQDVQSKAKARSVLAKAAAVAPDKANRDAIALIADAIARTNPSKPNSPSGGAVPSLRPECYYCCYLGCVGCSWGGIGGCIGCCAAGCLICN